MNLHKAKGLESPVVFLADPSGAGRNTHAPNFHVNRAGPEPEGYMQVERSVGEFGRAVLAHPPDWPAMEDEEREFHDAEMTRLLYVAATRAGSRLNISARESRPKDNPWKLFGDHLDRLPLLENPGAVSAKTSQGISLDVSDSARALAGIALRHERCAQRSYAVATPSSPVTSESESALRPTHKKRRVHESQVPHGIEWGAAIHGMLDRLMRAPDSDLHSLAVTALESEDLDIGFAEDAVRTISAVVSSEIWKRALAAKRRFVEIPFQCLSSHGDAETGAVPTVVRGVIDLVFEQDDGWVLVDYKTDAVSDVSVLKKRAAHYSSQLTHYRTAWEKLTSETVAESGFFFTHCGVYLTVPGMDEATV
jgi:ATP-dependent helicase/nuclease subunit A